MGLLRFLENNARSSLRIEVSVALYAVVYALAVTAAGRIQTRSGEQVILPDVQFHYVPGLLQRAFDDMTPAGRALYLKVLVVDSFLLVPLYTNAFGTLSALGLWLSGWARKWPVLRPLPLVLPLVMLVADELENVAFACMALYYPLWSEHLAWWAGLCTTIKFSSLTALAAVAGPALVYGAAAFLFGSQRRIESVIDKQ